MHLTRPRRLALEYFLGSRANRTYLWLRRHRGTPQPVRRVCAIRLCRPHWTSCRQKQLSMNNQGRSAAREGFAHQRARLLFSQQPNIYPSVTARTPNSEPKRQRDIVRNGLIGFISSGHQ